jgi:D-alanyl-D-alanine carboxypeptidase
VAVALSQAGGGRRAAAGTPRGAPCARAIGALLLAIGLFLTAVGPGFAHGAAVVVDAESGRVLHAENPNLRHYPASLAKIMTLYLTFEALEQGMIELTERVTVSAQAARQRGTRLRLRRGKTLTVKDAILGVIIRSANDAAVALAERLAGDEPAFAAMMTAKAKAIGMTRTVFGDATGLNDAGQWTTARDMAVLARALVRDFPQHYHYFSVRSFSFRGRTLSTYNGLIKSYKGADGIKTGFTCAAGYNIVASAERAGRRLIGVILGSTSGAKRTNRMARLLNAAFAGKTDAPEPPTLIDDLQPTDDAEAAEPHHYRASIDVCMGRGPQRGPRLQYVKGWAIDVGTFFDKAEARSAAIRAKSQLRQTLKGGSATVIPMPVGGMVRYVASVSGLKQKNATATCRGLRDQGKWCLVLSPQTIADKFRYAKRLRLGSS